MNVSLRYLGTDFFINAVVDSSYHCPTCQCRFIYKFENQIPLIILKSKYKNCTLKHAKNKQSFSLISIQNMFKTCMISTITELSML